MKNTAIKPCIFEFNNVTITRIFKTAFNIIELLMHKISKSSNISNLEKTVEINKVCF